MAEHPYQPLSNILDEALLQASEGKGKERHASGEPFVDQPICEMARRLGVGGPLYQATKKIYESQRLPGEAGVRELLGAINYIAAAIIVRREQGEVHEQQREERPGADGPPADGHEPG